MSLTEPGMNPVVGELDWCRGMAYVRSLCKVTKVSKGLLQRTMVLVGLMSCRHGSTNTLRGHVNGLLLLLRYNGDLLGC